MPGNAFDDLAVDVEKIAVVVEPAFPSNIEIPLAKIRLIVFEVFDSMSAAVMCLYRLSRALSES